MKVGTLLSRLLSILAIVGLVVGPFAAPVNGAAMAGASGMSMLEMPAGMPCCARETPAVPDCQKTCPVMVTCMAKCFSATPMPANEVFALWSDIIRPGSDGMADSLAAAPPARPPRT